jgi:hypothetical protein
MRAYALLLGSILTACAAASDEEVVASIEQASLTTNALTKNSLTTNSLTTNALTKNSLTTNSLTTNSLSSGPLAQRPDFHVDDASTKAFLKYAVECALEEGHTVTIRDGYGKYAKFYGLHGLAPEWEAGTCTTSCQRWVSACMMARTNEDGQRRILSMRKTTSAGADNASADKLSYPTVQEKADFPLQEGSFYGNLFASTPRLYWCYGSGSDYIKPRFGLNDSVIKNIGSCRTDASPSSGAWVESACQSTGSVSGANTNCSTGDYYDNNPATSEAYTQSITVYVQEYPDHFDYVIGDELKAGGTPCSYRVIRELGDSYCGDVAWDSVCVREAIDSCGTHSLCVTGTKQQYGDSDCIDTVCGWDSTCCTGSGTAWDAGCVALVESKCNVSCP